MGEGVQSVVGVHPEVVAGDKQGTRGAQRDVASPRAHGSGAHCGRGVVSRSCAHHYVLGQAQLLGHLGQQGAYRLIALKELGHLALSDAADVQHLPAPALVLHVQQQHAAGVGVVGTVDAGEDVVDVVLGKHDLADAGKVLRLMLLHPQNLGGSEPSEGDVGGEGGQLFPSHHLVEIVHLLGRAPVVPQDSRADHLVVLIQHHQAVHLAARSDARHLGLVKALQQGGDSLQHGGFPVLRVLLTPGISRS